MLRLPHWLVAIAAVVAVAACDKRPEQEYDRSSWDGAQPLTWDEYVISERERRARYEGTRYTRPGLPNMSRWKPSDFLPGRAMKAHHTEVCSMGEKELADFRRTVMDFPFNGTLDDMRTWGAQGVLRANIRLGRLCWSDYAIHRGLDSEPFLESAQMAASSGDPRAMAAYAHCLEERRWNQDPVDLPYSPDDPEPWLEHVSQYMDETSDEFLVDEAIYWYWRAARSLEPEALDGLARLLSEHHHPGPGYIAWPEGRSESLVQRARWTLLAEIARSIYDTRQVGDSNTPYQNPVQEFADSYSMSDEQLRRSRHLARTWLVENPDALAELVHREDLRDCNTDLSEHGLRFNFGSLNRHLQGLGLRYEPETGKLRHISNQHALRTDRQAHRRGGGH